MKSTPLLFYRFQRVVTPPILLHVWYTTFDLATIRAMEYIQLFGHARSRRAWRATIATVIYRCIQRLKVMRICLANLRWSRFLVKTTKFSKLPITPNVQMDGAMYEAMTFLITSCLTSSGDCCLLPVGSVSASISRSKFVTWLTNSSHVITTAPTGVDWLLGNDVIVNVL